MKKSPKGRPENLIPMASRTPEERAALGRKGQKISTMRKRQISDMRKLLESMVREEAPDGTGETWLELMNTAQILKAAREGDTKAWEALMKALGLFDDKEQNISVVSILEGVSGAKRRFKGR